MDGDRALEQGVIVGVFEHIAFSRYGQRVAVEVIEGDRDVDMWGTVAWDSDIGGYRVMVRAELRGLDLLRVLAHELAHVIHGGVGLGTVPEEFPGMRDRLAGRPTDAAAEIDAGTRALYADGSMFYWESAADAFGAALAFDLWPDILAAIRKVKSQEVGT